MSAHQAKRTGCLQVWLCSIPVVVLNSPGVSGHLGSNPGFGASDIIGIILWSIGWLIETIADIDKVTISRKALWFKLLIKDISSVAGSHPTLPSMKSSESDSGSGLGTFYTNHPDPVIPTYDFMTSVDIP